MWSDDVQISWAMYVQGLLFDRPSPFLPRSKVSLMKFLCEQQRSGYGHPQASDDGSFRLGDFT